MSVIKHLTPVNYKDYPEYMFAMIASFLPSREGDDLRMVAGDVCFKHTDKDGNTYKNGLLHSYNDLPAVKDSYGTQRWYKNGKLHRDTPPGAEPGDLPAVIYTRGGREWYKNDKLHREGDLPAVEDSYGTQKWYKNGKLHRDTPPGAELDDLPAVIYSNGTQRWYKNGKLHKETSPGRNQVIYR